MHLQRRFHLRIQNARSLGGWRNGYYHVLSRIVSMNLCSPVAPAHRSLSYGTILYFLSFFFNGRQRGIPITEVVGWVGGSNGVWIIFPMIGMYASYQLIKTGTFDVFRNQGALP
jgi:hypothetical protein